MLSIFPPVVVEKVTILGIGPEAAEHNQHFGGKSWPEVKRKIPSSSAIAVDRMPLVETDYFGGNGTQWAAAYYGNTELMPLKEADAGPINSALKAIGVRSLLTDRFTAVGLGEHRDWDDLFNDYFD